jgi:hypothetical protein
MTGGYLDYWAVAFGLSARYEVLVSGVGIIGVKHCPETLNNCLAAFASTCLLHH